MTITITNGTLTQISSTLTASAGYRVPTDIIVSGATKAYDDYTNIAQGAITLASPTSTVSVTATGLTEEERFNADINGITDIVNEKAGTSGEKYLPQVKHTAEMIDATPTITLTLSQVISQDPLAVQLTQAQIDIVESIGEGEVLKFDVSEFGYGVLPMMLSVDGDFAVVESVAWGSGGGGIDYIIGATVYAFQYDSDRGTMTAYRSAALLDTYDTTAAASDILDGETAYVNGEKITGNITIKAAQTYTPSTTNQTIAAGQYLNGAQIIQGDANLVAENIADGVTIFGVEGTHQGGLDYTVTFSAYGSDYYIASCLDEDSISAPPAPSKPGYVFGGWFTQEGGAGIEITFPYTPSADITLYAAFSLNVKATVSGLGSENPSDVSFTVDSEFTVANLCEEVTMGSNTFIKIPTMYRKVNTVVDNQITSFTIANYKVDNTYEPYPVFVEEDGVTVMPYVLVGKYWNTSSSSCVSTGTASPADVTIGTGRTYAKNRGTGYMIFDWMFQKLWQDLIVIFKRTINTNPGTAWTYDEMGIYWSTYGGWTDGMCHNSGVIAACDKPSKYVDNATTSTDGYFGVSYNLPTEKGEIQSLGYDSSHPFVSLPSAATSNGSYNTFYCDSYYCYYYASGSRPVYSHVGLASAVNGAFYCFAAYSWSDGFPVRLCYRPLSA